MRTVDDGPAVTNRPTRDHSQFSHKKKTFRFLYILVHDNRAAFSTNIRYFNSFPFARRPSFLPVYTRTSVSLILCAIMIQGSRPHDVALCVRIFKAFLRNTMNVRVTHILLLYKNGRRATQKPVSRRVFQQHTRSRYR